MQKKAPPERGFLFAGVFYSLLPIPYGQKIIFSASCVLNGSPGPIPGE